MTKKRKGKGRIVAALALLGIGGAGGFYAWKKGLFSKPGDVTTYQTTYVEGQEELIKKVMTHWFPSAHNFKLGDPAPGPQGLKLATATVKKSDIEPNTEYRRARATALNETIAINQIKTQFPDGRDFKAFVEDDSTANQIIYSIAFKNPTTGS